MVAVFEEGDHESAGMGEVRALVRREPHGIGVYADHPVAAISGIHGEYDARGVISDLTPEFSRKVSMREALRRPAPANVKDFDVSHKENAIP